MSEGHDSQQGNDVIAKLLRDHDIDPDKVLSRRSKPGGSDTPDVTDNSDVTGSPDVIDKKGFNDTSSEVEIVSGDSADTSQDQGGVSQRSAKASAKAALRQELETKTRALSEKGVKNPPAYRSVSAWAGAFIILPFLLAGVAFIFVVRAKNYLGSGVLEWLSENNLGSTITETASEAGFTWLPTLVEMYQYRSIAITACFVVCFVIAALFLWWDKVRRDRYIEKYDLSEEDELDDVIDDDNSELPSRRLRRETP